MEPGRALLSVQPASHPPSMASRRWSFYPSDLKKSEIEGRRGQEESHLTSSDLALLFPCLAGVQS